MSGGAPPDAAARAEEHFGIHWSVREGIIRLRAAAQGPGGLALVGDSLTEIMWWNSLAGQRTVNMGFGGARVRNILGHIDAALESARPDGAIVMATINNAALSVTPEETEAYQAEYLALIRRIRAAAERVALVTITPVEKHLPLSGELSNSRVQELNRAIRAVGAAEGLPVHDAYALLLDGGEDAPAGTTVDGIHLSAASYGKLLPLYEAAARGLYGG